MTSILQRRPDDRPPRQEEWGKGATMSLVAHLALVGALVWGVHWHSNSEPEGVTAELWSAVPQAAAPAPTAPPPEPTPPPPAPAPTPAPPPPPVVETPKPPDIVTEQLDKKKREREQEEARLAQQQAADKAKADAQAKLAAQQKADADKKAAQQKQLDAQKLAKLHDENLKRMLGQMDAPADSTGTAARSSGPSASYMGRIIARLRPNLTLIDAISGNPHVEVDIRCAPDGTIISRRVTKPSGTPEWDAAVLRAIDKAGVLPRDTDGRTPGDMVIAWNLQDAK